MHPVLPPDRFHAVCSLLLGPELAAADERAALHRRLVEEVSSLLVPRSAPAPTAPEVLAALPRAIGACMAPAGWRWNGFYVLADDGNLKVGPAFGPPVCALLERARDAEGRPLGPLSSGMCFDGLLLNQTLHAPDVKAWPGYVSCDATSGLETVSGLVSPLRDPAGTPLAVWDLDAVQPVTAADARLVDVLFGTLSRTLELERAHFAPR